MPFSIPTQIERIVTTLEGAGFEAYLVGGCIRDLLIGLKPKDWDVTTNATPEEIVGLFEKSFYDNSYGTVTIVYEQEEDQSLKQIQITPYRIEGKYSDQRHPDSVRFSKNIHDDLSRRDFTINAIAYNPSKGHFIDDYKGQEDIKEGTLRAVGSPESRFQEDALRLLRAVRLATQLGFSIEKNTEKALLNKASLINSVAKERVRDELIKIIMSKEPMKGFLLLEKTGLLPFILPEFVDGIGMEQNEAHSFHVWEHTLRTLQHSADKDWPLHVRLGALFHDVGKPKTRQWSNEKNNWTFYGHDVVGARIAKKALERLKFSREMTELVTKLVRYHLFFSDVDKITMSAVRRLIASMGKEYIWDLMKVRACDRIGTGRPKEAPYRLRKYESMIEEAMEDPISVGMLKINGGIIIEKLHVNPSPRIGYILHALLEEVLENPKNNNEEYLLEKAIELNKLDEESLKKIGEKGKESKESAQEEKVSQIRKKHWVK
jgi:putative nucleotidyltransferase with HDIG domain